MSNQLTDPQESLPEELFTQLISTLRSRNIIKLTAVSKTWRRVINETPSLHQDVDLSDLDYTPELLRALQQLSSLSNHRIRKVYLCLNEDVTEDFERINQRKVHSSISEDRKWSISMISLPFEILERSSQTLKDIKLGGSFSPLSAPLLLTILHRLSIFVNLKRFEAKATFPFRLEAGDASLGQKKIIIWSASSGFREGDARQAVFIMKLIRQIAGSGFTSFRTTESMDWEGPGKEEAVACVFEELSHSTATMKDFSWWSDYSPALLSRWNFWLHCQKLESLALTVNSQTVLPLKGRTLLPVPLEPFSMNLKEMTLDMFGGRIQWDHLARRIGQALEEFTFKVVPSEEILWHFSIVRFLSHFNQTLVTIELEMDYLEEPDTLIDPSPSQLSFPLLRYLKMDSCDDTTYQFFSKVNSPSLQTLEFHPIGEYANDEFQRFGEEMSSLTQIEVNCLTSLFRNNSANLKHVHSVCHLENESRVKVPQEVLHFPYLEDFDIRPGGQALDSAFSGFQFPNLKTPRQ